MRVLRVGRGYKNPVKCHKRVEVPPVELVQANKTMMRASRIHSIWVILLWIRAYMCQKVVRDQATSGSLHAPFHPFVILQPWCLVFLLRPSWFHVHLITFQRDTNGWWPARVFDVWLVPMHAGPLTPVVLGSWWMREGVGTIIEAC